MESGEVEKRKSKTTIVLGIFLVFVIIITVLILNLFKEKVTNTSSDAENVSTTSLYCTTKTKTIPDAFFDFKDAESVDQTMKVIFKNKKIDNIAYSADVVYADNKKAVNKEAELHVKYGMYMQDNGREMTDFSPNFSVNDANVKISLFASMKQLNNALIKVFAINTDSSLSDYSPKVLAALYAEKSFNCEIKE